MAEKSIIVADWNIDSIKNAPLASKDLREYLAALQALGVNVLTLQNVTKSLDGRASETFDIKSVVEKSVVNQESFYTPLWEADELHGSEKTLYFHGPIQNGLLTLLLDPGYRFVVHRERFYQGEYRDFSHEDEDSLAEAEYPRALQRTVILLNCGNKGDGNRLQLINNYGPDRPTPDRMQKCVRGVLDAIDPKLPTVVAGDFCCKPDTLVYRDMMARNYLRSAWGEMLKAAELCADPIGEQHQRNNLLFGRDWIVPIAFAVLGPQPKVFDFGPKRESRLLNQNLTKLPNCPTANPPVLFEFVVSWLQTS